jgi:Zn-dependent M28 family amino/carboxypeptidase
LRIFLKKTILFLLLCLFTGRLAAQYSLLSDSIAATASLQETVSALAHDSMKGRKTGTPEAAFAAAYIARQFSAAGLRRVKGIRGYYHPFRGLRGGADEPSTQLNVVGAIEGKKSTDTLVIFCAHYDHVGKGLPDQMEGRYKGRGRMRDDIYNGANDNATGVAALIELAKYFAAMDSTRYTLLFVAFGGEEQGLFGSSEMANQINPKMVKLVINLEMLGNPGKYQKPFIVGQNDTDSMVHFFNRTLIEENPGYEKKYFITDPYPEARLLGRSDHYPFIGRGIPAYCIMATSPHDPYYHTPEDETATIEFSRRYEVTRAVAIVCTKIIRE